MHFFNLHKIFKNVVFAKLSLMTISTVYQSASLSSLHFIKFFILFNPVVKNSLILISIALIVRKELTSFQIKTSSYCPNTAPMPEFT